MPIAQDILKEINEETRKPQTTIGMAVDSVRRKYLKLLSEIVKRPVIIYADNFTHPNSGISLEDVHSFMSMCCGIKKNKDVCLVLHTPGGEINALEALVKYIRSQFEKVDVIVPMFAFSAGTMLCCACDNIYMGKNSFLGPIDPQRHFTRADGQRVFYPAQALVDQFELAKKECELNPSASFAWTPILKQYAPTQIIQCKNSVERSKILVKDWLKKYKHLDNKTANNIANWLGQHNKHKDHGRPLSVAELQMHHLPIKMLEDNQEMQDIALSLYHTIEYSFEVSKCRKFIENSSGCYIIKM